MWNGYIVISAVKILRVVQIPSVTKHYAFLEPKVTSVS